MNIYFDIETNDIHDWIHLSDVKTVLCMAVSIDGEEPKIVDIKDGLTLLQNADQIIGHNIQSFDIPALQKLYPTFKPDPAKIVDTLLMCRLLHADQRERDFQIKDLPKELVGSQSLKAWGIRLGNAKGEAPDFTKDTEQLREYCKQDVRVTAALHQHLLNHPSMPSAAAAVTLEHQFAAIIREQERVGFPFDIEAAQRLHGTLLKDQLDIEQKLQEVFPPIVTERRSEKTGKRLKSKVEQFNPGSRLQIAQRLISKYNWVPMELTPDGKPRVDESVLASLDYPEAKILSRYLTVQKRLGQLADGDEAWLKAVAPDGRLHGRVNTNGAITGRCTHRSPNMAQVPTDKEYRSLFVPSRGKVLVGVDASGLELRCLAHYLGKYDGKKYAQEILTGDIHWTNAIAFGLIKDVPQDKTNPEHKAARNQAKGAIYALIYGAGNDKLGMVLGGDKKRGSKARANFEAKVPAYTRLKADVALSLASNGFLRGLDFRPLYPRSEYAALNTLLQSAGAVVMKKACVNAWVQFDKQPVKMDVEQVASVHDEYQFMVSKNYAESVGNIVVWAIQQAGADFDFRCPLDGEYRVGANWAETH
jgi:DNA polymerase I-like protein with 3'-5' exonuclease and polymerase domains